MATECRPQASAVRNQRKRVKSESRAAAGDHFFRRNPVLPSSVAIMVRKSYFRDGAFTFVDRLLSHSNNNHDRDSKWYKRGLILFSWMVTESACTRLLDQMCPAPGAVADQIFQPLCRRLDRFSNNNNNRPSACRPDVRRKKQCAIDAYRLPWGQSQIERKLPSYSSPSGRVVPKTPSWQLALTSSVVLTTTPRRVGTD